MLGIICLLLEIAITIFIVVKYDFRYFKDHIFTKHYADLRMEDVSIFVEIFVVTFFNGILVFGSLQKRRTPILVWMVLAVIKLIYYDVIALISFIINSISLWSLFVFTILRIFLYIWALVVAGYAKRDLKLSKGGIVHDQTLQELPTFSQQPQEMHMVPLHSA